MIPNPTKVTKFFEGHKNLCPTKIFSKKACIFRLFYWTKVAKVLFDKLVR